MGLLLLLLLAAGGCTRGQYRRAADSEVRGLVDRAGCDPRWELNDFTIQPNAVSRMYDPNCPDRPPMTPDDPTSNRLMHCVDGKPGWLGWDRRYGKTQWVENPCWQQYLPFDRDGSVVLDRRGAVEMALVHSPEYQRALEDLYLSALDVTFQRFRFDVQFFGQHSTFLTADGPARAGNSVTQLSVDDSIEARRLTATGGELIVGLANSLVWQFSGPNTNTATTLLDFSLVQPLLRGAGRAVVLEQLTQSQRTLLANVRQMEQFRRGFYTQITAGRNLVLGPGRGLLTLAALLPTSSAAATGGMFSLMAEQVRIRNQQLNVNRLRESLRRFEELNRADRVDGFQVEFARQALFNAQSRLLQISNTYQDRLDAFKITLGLPPDLPVRIDDPLLRQFDLIDPELIASQETVSRVLGQVREQGPAGAPQVSGAAETARQRVAMMLAMVRADMRQLERALPQRRADLKRLATRTEVKGGDVDFSAVSQDAMEARVATIRADFDVQQQQLEAVMAELANMPKPEGEGTADMAQADPAAKEKTERLVDFLSRLENLLRGLALTQARARLETATLVPVSLEPAEATRIACENRLDWMNARAALVDAWRQIEVQANALQSDLNVTFSGDMGTLGDNPVKFRSTTGRLRVGLQWDPPLTRLAERNLYRETLIDYQRARRHYYAFEDRVKQNLRDTLRNIRTSQLDFELRRAGVNVAIKQVELTQFKLDAPTRPGEVMKPLESNAARDLIGALSGLLQAQNDFLNQWIDYEAQRLNLDLELGTMRLDDRGMWIDPGPIDSGGVSPATDAPREVRHRELPAQKMARLLKAEGGRRKAEGEQAAGSGQ